MKIFLREFIFIFFILVLFNFSPGFVFASSNVVINEFLANPSSGQGEWVELYNPTGSDVDLKGWVLSDKSGSRKNLDSLNSIAAGGFAVYEYQGDGWLNNTASESKPESITLTDNSGNQIDNYLYSLDQKENITTGRSPDASDNWVVLAQATKGSSNSGPSEAPTQTPTPTSISTKIPTPTSTPKPTASPKITDAQVTNSNPQTVTSPTSIEIASDQFLSPSGAGDNLDNQDIASQQADVLGTQSSVLSQTPSPTKIKSNKILVKDSNLFPKIFIVFGLFLLCACGILTFRKLRNER